MINIQWAAYMMATVKHECANTWQPIEEYGKGAGHDYGKLASVKGSDGEMYSNNFYGRGFVQLTWVFNYLRLGKALGLGDKLLCHPEKVLELETAYQILSAWMVGGYSANRKRMLDCTLGAKPNYQGSRH